MLRRLNLFQSIGYGAKIDRREQILWHLTRFHSMGYNYKSLLIKGYFGT